MGGSYNSTTVDKDTPHFNTPLNPIMETTIDMSQSDGLSPEDSIVQDIMDDTNINPNLLQATINTLSSRINTMQSAQATPTSSSSPFDHQGSATESSDNDSSQPKHSSNNQLQHHPSTSELKKLKAEFEERHRINTECIKQNVSMQHHRDLQTVRDEAQRRLDDALSQVRSTDEKAIAQSRQIDNLQSQLNQLSQLVRQQQQTPTNIDTPQHNMTQKHNFSLLPPTHTQSHTHQHT